MDLIQGLHLLLCEENWALDNSIIFAFHILVQLPPDVFNVRVHYAHKKCFFISYVNSILLLSDQVFCKHLKMQRKYLLCKIKYSMRRLQNRLKTPYPSLTLTHTNTIFLSMYLPIHLSIYISFSQSLNLYLSIIYLSICLSICLSINLSI